MVSSTTPKRSYESNVLLVTLFAIGSCYDSIAEPATQQGSDSTATLHEHFFKHATSVTHSWAAQRTVEHICTLLAQCFYLLATCQTDRCWTTLGMAVRIAQSLGLHVEGDQFTAGEATRVSQESRRRLWYSLFVLDRLVALQLGRPPAIGDQSFNVQKPSQEGIVEMLNDIPTDVERQHDEPLDYFIAVIEFSEVIGRVFHRLYGPRKADTAVSTLATIGGLDTELLKWKLSLPRNLRFDLPHTFESVITLKRQVSFRSLSGTLNFSGN